MSLLDVIILTNTKDDKIYHMTSKAIDSLKKSSQKHDFHIILMESNKESNYKYDVDIFYVPEEDFNYNVFLNKAIGLCKGDYTCISNNDVYFHDKWYDNLHEAIIKYNLDTASPKSKIQQKGIVPRAEIKHRFTPLTKVVEGYQVVYTFCGWCWVMTKDVREWLFPLDEQFAFFFQDNDMICRLEEKGCRHALVGNSLVDHYGQTSHYILQESGKWHSFTFGLEKNFIDKWKHKLEKPS